MMDCTEWQPYFAWEPVYVDAYSEGERQNGKFSFPKRGWVERRLHIWTDDEFGDGPIEHRVWRFRLARCPPVRSENKT